MEEHSISEYESYNGAIDESKSYIKLNRRVKFPSDESIVTHFIEPLNPWKDVRTNTNEEILNSYEQSCQKLDIKPLPSIIIQLKALPSLHEGRLSCLLLKDLKLSVRQVEALEEVLKRVRFVTIDLENALKNDEACASLLDSIEYYESATHLVLRRNTDAGLWTWKAVCHLIRRSSFLESLDCSNTNLMQYALIPFTRSLRQNHSLSTLDLSDCHMSGRPLHFLVNSLKMNRNIRNLSLRSNRLTPRDMVKLGEMLRVNHWVQYLNISFNPIQDNGMRELMLALLQQINVTADQSSGPNCPNVMPSPTDPSGPRFVFDETTPIDDSAPPASGTEGAVPYPTPYSVVVVRSPPPSPATPRDFCDSPGGPNGAGESPSGDPLTSPDPYDRSSLAPPPPASPSISELGPGDADQSNGQGSPPTEVGHSAFFRGDFGGGDNGTYLPSPSLSGLRESYRTHTTPPDRDLATFGTGLRHLSSASTQLTARAVADLVTYLAHPRCTLKNLCLGMNPLGDEAILDLKSSLLKNRSLHKLDLRQCKIGDEASIALAEVLGNEPGGGCNLKNLDLRQNPAIKFAGVLALARALELNHTLQHLALGDDTTNTASSSPHGLTKPPKTGPKSKHLLPVMDQTRVGTNTSGSTNGHSDTPEGTVVTTSISATHSTPKTVAAQRSFHLSLKNYHWSPDNWLLSLISPGGSAAKSATSDAALSPTLPTPNSASTAADGEPNLCHVDIGSRGVSLTRRASSPSHVCCNGAVIGKSGDGDKEEPSLTQHAIDFSSLRKSIDDSTDIPTYLANYKIYIESLCQRNRQFASPNPDSHRHDGSTN